MYQFMDKIYTFLKQNLFRGFPLQPASDLNAKSAFLILFVWALDHKLSRDKSTFMFQTKKVQSAYLFFYNQPPSNFKKFCSKIFITELQRKWDQSKMRNRNVKPRTEWSIFYLALHDIIRGKCIFENFWSQVRMKKTRHFRRVSAWAKFQCKCKFCRKTEFFWRSDAWQFK